MTFAKLMYAQLLYWLALRFQFGAAILDGQYALTPFESWCNGIGQSLMSKSNQILSTAREYNQSRDAYERKLWLYMTAVAYNPNRLPPVDPE